MMVSVPFCAPEGPPETGQSRKNASFFSRSCLEMPWVVFGSPVLKSIQTCENQRGVSAWEGRKVQREKKSWERRLDRGARRGCRRVK